MRKINFGKILSAITLSILFLLPNTVLAAEIKTEFNPMCWTEQECKDKRTELWGAERANGGWLEKEGKECNKIGWGKCLAGNVTETQISFGGTKSFSNLGEYIKTIYNYGLVVIGILAVIMIVMAGAQWITSAGSSERITQSKKRISGAIIGLFIAYMSYIILKSINPATVNLRLPQVYLIKSQVLPSKWCKDVPKNGGQDTKFALAADKNNQKSKVEATGSESPWLVYSNDNPYSVDFWCGKRYFVSGADADTTCLGDRCDFGYVCSNFEPPDSNNPYHCIVGTITGEVKNLNSGTFEGLVSDNWEDVDGEELYLVCLGTGESVEVDAETSESGVISNKQQYTISASAEDLKDAVAECGGETKVRGGFMKLDFTPSVSGNILSEESHLIGKDGKDIAGGLLVDAVVDYPAIIKTEALIPYALMKAGTTVDVDAKSIKMWEKMTESFLQTWSVIFTDDTVISAMKDKLKDVFGYYKDYIVVQYSDKVSK
ncbi:MAG: pilin [Patescibacteria group bacterium]